MGIRHNVVVTEVSRIWSFSLFCERDSLRTTPTTQNHLPTHNRAPDHCARTISGPEPGITILELGPFYVAGSNDTKIDLLLHKQSY